MKINYQDADGRVTELEVNDEIGTFYITSLDAEQKNDRRETRRHTSLSEFIYGDERFFDSGIDVCRSVAMSDAVKHALDKLTRRQRHLLVKVYADGWRYTELADFEKRDESTIRKATEKAKEKFLKFFFANYPI